MIPPVFSDDVEARAREVDDPFNVDPLSAIELRLICDMFPGRLLTEGVRASRGRSVGGRGAGPGFMNCSRLYILEGGQGVSRTPPGSQSSGKAHMSGAVFVKRTEIGWQRAMRTGTWTQQLTGESLTPWRATPLQAGGREVKARL